MKDLVLIYVNHVGKDYMGNYVYEFIFSNTIEGVDGNEWDTYPASGRPEPPYPIYIKYVGKLESELKLDTVQNSDTFAIWDAIDGVIALAWENVDGYENYPDTRLCFRFGETYKDVEAKLYEKDLILENNTKNNEKEKSS